jgi:4-diphosphocytidyl-2C-methyl-D-erythritol kinase
MSGSGTAVYGIFDNEEAAGIASDAPKKQKATRFQSTRVRKPTQPPRRAATKRSPSQRS